MIRVGPAGWSYADWEGAVYPREKGPGFHALRHLARYVDMVELNSSFYALPRADHARRWVGLVADRPDFRFTAKLHNSFTHEPLPADDHVLARALAEYRAGLAPLHEAGKLAALLVQFPLSFRWNGSAAKRLSRLAEMLGPYPLVLEVRHRSWFDREPLEVVERLGYSLARIDLPSAPDHPPAAAPDVGPVGYLRVHGRNAAAWFDPKAGRDRRYDYLYAPAEVGDLVETTRRLATGRDETYVVTNNHFAGKAVANAIEIMAGLGRDRPLAPVELVRTYPRLERIVRTEGQATLF